MQKPAEQTQSFCDVMQPQARRALDVIRYGVITATPQTPVHQALAWMVDLNITGLPVVNQRGCLEGMITEKDLLVLLYKKQSTGGIVEMFMNRDVVSFAADSSLEEICRCLSEHSFRRVPITEKGKVISVISRTDLLRVNLHKFESHSDVVRPFQTGTPFPVWQVMNKGLITVTPESSVLEAATAMSEYSLSGLPIVTGNMKLAGIITEKDLMPYFYGTQTPPDTAGELMATEVTTFGPADSMMDVCECLIANHFRRVPIVKDGVLVGLVSRADVIRYILRNIARVSQYQASHPIR